MAKTIIVTGGSGFIGSNLIRYILTNSDWNVVNIDALTYAGNPENLSDIEHNPLYQGRYFFEHGDICDATFVNEICERYVLYGIINCAAESHVDRSIQSAKPFVDTNITGTLVLLEAAKKYEIQRYLQVSTDEVYGSLGSDGYFTEETPLAPNSPYSASKTAADCLVRAFVHTHNLNAVITRCSNNYGPFQFPEKLIPLMISNAMNDRSLPVYGNGLNVRDWIYVDDHCAGIWSAFQDGKQGEVYNFGGNSERTNIDVVKTILSSLGKDESLITYVQDRPGHDLRYAIDCTKAENLLGWKPTVSFEEGLQSTIEWYKNNASWVEHIRSGEYLEYYKRQYGTAG
jgi:dTDP-glucose 4,6-dehydratase